jgi:hypothetical protein
VVEFGDSDSSILEVLWPISGRGLATVEEAGFRIWGVEAGAPKVISALPKSELPDATIAAGSWDPHTPGVVALAAGTSVSIVDTRAMKCVPHGAQPRALRPMHL